MGSVGDFHDNSPIEAFWSRWQVELLNTGGAHREAVNSLGRKCRMLGKVMTIPLAQPNRVQPPPR